MLDQIKLEGKTFKKEYKEVLNNIKKFDRIAIFRHIMPDFDALGSQFGLATWIKEFLFTVEREEGEEKTIELM